ncbi:hypothetical protein CPSG_04794 [Coccidioides posadasii str. Silveira]|uniref:Uncharacterized protein n=1 Tax=Coccidioides posadasii (strain RMSCC 757 / Silveira) TaxID=443226 RepID=E9D5B4_COCPS|nr:hypothetical protein CPSG_04794 [Coccidioides posadasii str. Silveira]
MPLSSPVPRYGRDSDPPSQKSDCRPGTVSMTRILPPHWLTPATTRLPPSHSPSPHPHPLIPSLSLAGRAANLPIARKPRPHWARHMYHVMMIEFRAARASALNSPRSDWPSFLSFALFVYACATLRLLLLSHLSNLQKERRAIDGAGPRANAQYPLSSESMLVRVDTGFDFTAGPRVQISSGLGGLGSACSLLEIGIFPPPSRLRRAKRVGARCMTRRAKQALAATTLFQTSPSCFTHPNTGFEHRRQESSLAFGHHTRREWLGFKHLTKLKMICLAVSACRLATWKPNEPDTRR